VSRGTVDKSVVFVKTSTFDFRSFFEAVEEFKLLGHHVNLFGSNDHKVAHRRAPVNLLHNRSFRQGHLVNNLPRGEVVHENTVVGVDQDLPERSRIKLFNFGQSLFVEADLLNVTSVKVTNSNLSIHVQDTNLVLRQEDSSESVVPSLLQTTVNPVEILVEVINNKARILAVKVEDERMRGLVPVVVVDGLGLVQKHLLRIRVDSREKTLLLGREVVVV